MALPIGRGRGGDGDAHRAAGQQAHPVVHLGAQQHGLAGRIHGAAEITAVDLTDATLAVARAMGADHVIDYNTEDIK